MMADDLELVEVADDAPSQEERDRFEELIATIRTRCNGAGIEIEQDEGGDFDLYFLRDEKAADHYLGYTGRRDTTEQ